MKETEYLFTFLDKEGNIHNERIITCLSKEDSLLIASRLLKITPYMQDEVCKIKTRKLPIKNKTS